MNKKKLKYIVKDTDGKNITVMADNWSASPSGLEFSVKGETVAYFVRFANFRKVDV